MKTLLLGIASFILSTFQVCSADSLDTLVFPSVRTPDGHTFSNATIMVAKSDFTLGLSIQHSKGIAWLTLAQAANAQWTLPQNATPANTSNWTKVLAQLQQGAGKRAELDSINKQRHETPDTQTRTDSSPAQTNGVNYTDILVSPEKFVGQEVTMRGAFSFKHNFQKSFQIQQGDNYIEVFYELLPKEAQTAILNQQGLSMTPVTVKGTVKREEFTKNSYYIMASSISWK